MIKNTSNQSKILDATYLAQVAVRLLRDLEPEESWTEKDEANKSGADVDLMNAIKKLGRLYYQGKY